MDFPSDTALVQVTVDEHGLAMLTINQQLGSSQVRFAWLNSLEPFSPTRHRPSDAPLRLFLQLKYGWLNEEADHRLGAEDAKFGLPELSVGTIPGARGTQRLAKIVGKHKAMHLILTSSTITDKELEQLGVVAQAFPLDELYESSLAAARRIASRSLPVVQLAKQEILSADETNLEAGLKLERSLYYSSFALEDRTEGMQACIEKRPPVFKNQ
ncbi:hypothetical protein BUE80_DR009799 [Diplocarpon rosae]|nr:hypothetical protein BUE80_DR009799 [Diplocarpon rosae]